MYNEGMKTPLKNTTEQEAEILLALARAGVHPTDMQKRLEAVLHQLEHGEASEGDLRDIAWCARNLREVVAQEGK